jgi:hypothetical protein
VQAEKSARAPASSKLLPHHTTRVYIARRPGDKRFSLTEHWNDANVVIEMCVEKDGYGVQELACDATRRTDLSALEAERGDGALLRADERALVVLGAGKRRLRRLPDVLVVPIKAAYLVLVQGAHSHGAARTRQRERQRSRRQERAAAHHVLLSLYITLRYQRSVREAFGTRASEGEGEKIFAFPLLAPFIFAYGPLKPLLF